MQKNKLIPIVLGVAVVGIAATVALLNQPSGARQAKAPAKNALLEANTTVPRTTSSAAQTLPASGTYTLAQVATHTDASSCWSAINGGVYDLTSWVVQHPGGSEAILRICGTDGSTAFNNQHGSSRRVTAMLQQFKIGDLAVPTTP